MYIREAHTTDGWQLDSNIDDNVLFALPKNSEERTCIAKQCVEDLKLEIPALVDGEENAVDRAYSAWPDRLYLIDRDGRVAFKSEPGPFGFDPDDLRAAIAASLR